MEKAIIDCYSVKMSQNSANRAHATFYRSVPLDLPMPPIVFDHIAIEPVNSIDDYALPDPELFPVEVLNKEENKKQPEKKIKKERKKKVKLPPVRLSTNEKAKKWTKKEINIKTFGGEFSAATWSPANDNANKKIELKDDTKENKANENTQEKVVIKKVNIGKVEKKKVNHIYPCLEITCDKIFHSYDSFRKHLVVHKPKHFKCSECGKSFVQKSKLKRHELVHTGERSYVCNFEGCNKSFSLDFNFKKHLRIHTGDKPFACPVNQCKKKYAQSCELQMHMFDHRE